MESFSGGNVVMLKGSVHLRHSSRELFSDFAQWNRSTGTVLFSGNVVIVDTGYTITSDKIIYNKRTQHADAHGNVQFTSVDTTLFVVGKDGFYDGAEQFVRMSKSPHLTKIDSAGTKLELNSKILLHFIEQRRSVAIESVKVMLYPADTARSPMIIYCDSMEYHQDSNFVIAIGDVRVFQDSVSISAPMARMWRSTGKVVMNGGTMVKDPNWTLWSDSLFAKISRRGGITSVVAFGEPRGKWHDPVDTMELTQDSRFSSNVMAFDFIDGKISKAYLIGRASVDYFPAPVDTSLTERHITSGDSVCAMFADGRIDSVEVWGGVQGISYRIRADGRDSIIYSGEMMALSQTKRIHLYKNTHIKYETMQLWAGQVHFDGDVKVLVAHPLVVSDSLVGEPFMMDKQDSLRASGLAYNVETKRGKLAYGRTAADKGFFTGEQTAKANGDTFYIKNATFTTCELMPPHYHFFSPELKLIPRDKAIVRPVWMYIGKLPVFWLPYFVFSVKAKRHSGLLTMDVGKFQAGQRFVRNLGYYIAPNDYFDLYAALDIDEEQGIYIKGELNYALRYYFSGKLFGSYKLTSERDWDSGHSLAKRWEVRGSHNHNIGEKGKFSASISLVSDADYLTETEEDPYERMDRTLRSYGAFTQGFDWGSFSLSADRTENIDDNTKTMYLPKMSIRKYSSELFGNGEKWYNKFYASANIGMVGYSYTDAEAVSERHYGADCNSAITWSYSFGDYITLSPSLSLAAVVMDMAIDSSKFPMLATYSISTGAATNLYGNIPIGILGIKYFHHTISPTVSFGFSPEVKNRDKFYSIPGISVPSGSKSAYMKFNLGQQFGLKLSDSTGTIRKLTLFTMGNSFSYNFIADGRKFSDINTSLRAKPARWLSITASIIHTLYSGDDINPTGIYPLSANMNNSLNFRFSIPFPTKPRETVLTITHYLSQNIQTGVRSHWIKTGLNTFITPNWRIGYDIYYDIEGANKVSDEFRLWRDMHCWEATFVWVPQGVRAGYYFRINIKQLPEIKIEKTEGSVRWR